MKPKQSPNIFILFMLIALSVVALVQSYRITMLERIVKLHNDSIHGLRVIEEDRQRPAITIPPPSETHKASERRTVI